jgi:16S rRNA (cytosine1402-N4)-methyltransferase
MTGSGHLSVLCDEAVSALAPREGGVYVDATYGAGGYTQAIFARARCKVFGFDRDPDAATRGRRDAASASGELLIVEAPFGAMETELKSRGVDLVDGVVFDVGVSSMQLDQGARGFSFRLDGPLSMRMDKGKPDARDIVNSAGADELALIFRAYGEEPAAKRIAHAIDAARGEKAIATTVELADIVARAAPARPGEKTHPATRVFQALRIFVNDELGELARGLSAAERLLKPGGNLAVVSFHSLEDRMVKRFFADRSGAAAGPSRHAPPRNASPATFSQTSAKAVTPSEVEIGANPRARSAKLRAGERTAAPANPSMAFAAQSLSFSIADWS